MANRSSKRLCVVPYLSGVGGPSSFQLRLVRRLAAHGIETCHELSDTPYDAVLVIGGTRQLVGLWRARQRGIPILQRLNGMNWIHRRYPTGSRHFLRAERGNLLLSTIRTRMADIVVYQSQFARSWWERERGSLSKPTHIVHNGVDLTEFHPTGTGERPADHYRLLLVEGALGGGYELGLDHAIALTKRIAKKLDTPVHLMVAGKISPAIRARAEGNEDITVQWAGVVPRERIPELDRSAHLLYAADLNAACPNAVIEAMACGLPVVAFETGALPELVQGDSGRLAPYGGDPWKLDPPDIDGLADAALEVLSDPPRFQAGARARAEAAFGLDQMVKGYLTALGWDE
ncbi:MAG: glycosyltransferase family 4 protein [Anaerolineaceae bacterium]|nr:MAG: glycosyltransferase family 4 protein [Anaerolineaceae bacterium]